MIASETGTHLDSASRVYVYAGAGLDFVAKKTGKFYVVEVKANRSRLESRRRSGHQLALLDRAKAFGFIPLLVHVTVILKISTNKVIIEEL